MDLGREKRACPRGPRRAFCARWGGDGAARGEGVPASDRAGQSSQRLRRPAGALAKAGAWCGAPRSMDLTVRIGSLLLKNPLIAASGCFGYGVEYAEAIDLSTLGAIAVKGLFLSEREGHPAPRIVETPAGMLNAIGL